MASNIIQGGVKMTIIQQIDSDIPPNKTNYNYNYIRNNEVEYEWKCKNEKKERRERKC